MSIKTLVQSHEKFREEYYNEYTDYFHKLAREGQHPRTLFISCSDSRVVPNIITNTQPGELFIDRNIGNIVPPYSIDGDCVAVPASIEYAVHELKVENIIICGHTDCGACKALYEDLSDDAEILHIKKWLIHAEVAKEKAIKKVGIENRDLLYMTTEKLNIIEQLIHLTGYPLVKKRLGEGKLFVQGWYYHIDSGTVEYFDPAEYCFKPIEKVLEKL